MDQRGRPCCNKRPQLQSSSQFMGKITCQRPSMLHFKLLLCLIKRIHHGPASALNTRLVFRRALVTLDVRVE